MSKPDSSSKQPTAPPPRWRRILSGWWAPASLLFIAIALLAFVWLDPERENRQEQHIGTMIFAGIALTATFIWFILLSAFAWRTRRTVLQWAIVLLLVLPACFQIEGVDGDLLPIVRWRWAVKPDRTIEPMRVTKQATPVATPTKDDAGKKDDAKSMAAPATPATAPTNLPASQDFSQFLGSQRDGIIRGIKLQRDFAAHPPRLLWRQPIGAAWSAFSVQGQRAITQEQRSENELVVCYDLFTGQPLWSHADIARYETTIAGIGPRASPTIHENAVYTLGATGILNCLDLATGDLRWTVNTLTDTDAPLLDWGMAGSPLVEGELIIINTGGKQATLAAYDRVTGKRRWVSGSEATSYASPTILTLLGARQVVMQNQFTITGHAIDDGRVLWSHPAPGAHPKVAQPIALADNSLFISSGYGTGSDLFELKRETAGTITTKSLWKNVNLKAKFANVVQREGHLYGLNDGTLVCLDAATGQRIWRGERYGHGQILLVNDALLIQAENGEVVLVQATPDEFKELSKFTAFSEKTWNSPALAGRYLLVRNDREAACFEMAVNE